MRLRPGLERRKTRGPQRSVVCSWEACGVGSSKRPIRARSKDGTPAREGGRPQPSRNVPDFPANPVIAPGGRGSAADAAAGAGGAAGCARKPAQGSTAKPRPQGSACVLPARDQEAADGQAPAIAPVPPGTFQPEVRPCYEAGRPLGHPKRWSGAGTAARVAFPGTLSVETLERNVGRSGGQRQVAGQPLLRAAFPTGQPSVRR
jgi:hypothetical protein